MNEYERVREKIEELLIDGIWEAKQNPEVPIIGELLDQILSLVEIRADDQSLPEPTIESLSYESASKNLSSWVQRSGYVIAQQAMLKAGFIRVIPKRK